MRRIPLCAALIGGGIAVTTAGLAHADRHDIVPITGGDACRPAPPHLLGTGRAPLAPLRVDLAGIAHRTQALSVTQTFDQRLRLIDGAWHAATSIRKIAVTMHGEAVSSGGVAVSERGTISFPATKTIAGRKGETFTVKGRTDTRSGGLLGGTAGNDHLPDEAVGIGASWTVVTCDDVDEDVPAKQVRTYVLRSIAHGVAVMTMRDVISMDRTRRDLGTQTIGGEKVGLRLDRVKGTRTGTYRLPLAHALAAETTEVARLEIRFHAVSKNVPATQVITRVVERRTDRPA